MPRATSVEADLSTLSALAAMTGRLDLYRKIERALKKLRRRNLREARKRLRKIPAFHVNIVAMTRRALVALVAPLLFRQRYFIVRLDAPVRRYPLADWRRNEAQLNRIRNMTLADINPASPVFDMECEAVATEFIAESHEPGFNGLRPLILASIRHLARTSSLEYRRDVVEAICSAMILLPYIDPSAAHFNSEVVAMKGAGEDHPLFHLSPNTPIEAIHFSNSV